MNEQFKWVDFYEKFASKLLEFKDSRWDCGKVSLWWNLILLLELYLLIHEEKNSPNCFRIVFYFRYKWEDTFNETCRNEHNEL